MPPRIINFNPQVFQPIQPTQNPKSVLAQLLLQRGSQLDNTRGAGIRSAGELITGALLQKSAFNQQQKENQEKARKQGELIKTLFPRGPDTTRPGPDVLPENQNFFAAPDSPLTGDVAPDPIKGVEAIFPRSETTAAPSFETGPPISPDPLVPGPDISVPGRPNQLGQLLAGLNESQAAQGGIPANSIFSAFQQQQARLDQTFRVDAGDRFEIRSTANPSQVIETIPKGISPATRVSALTSQLNRENQQLISENTIRSREQIAELNRDAKAGQRVKVNVLLGNDQKSGRPISQVGFARKNDPSDIKFVGKPTVKGAGNQVNVSNLPQVPATLLTAITQSDISLRSLDRVQAIFDRIGKNEFASLVGPFDNLKGEALEAAGIPIKDQQTIGNITKDLTDALGRMRSGGVIGEEEWETFMALVPQRSDNFQTFINKMADFRAKLGDIRGANINSARTFGFNIGTSGSPQPQQSLGEFSLDELEAEKRRRQGNG